MLLAPALFVARKVFETDALFAGPDPRRDALETRLLDLVDGRTPLKVLCQSGPGSEKENARALYAFFCLDLVRSREGAGVRKLQWKTDGGALAQGD